MSNVNPFILAKENADQWFNETVVSLLSEARFGTKLLAPDTNEKRKAFVVVYGHTRSGKTTVVLKLLQIKESKFFDIYNALCGGRGAGDPTTPPAAFKYTKVHDHRFSFTTYDGATYQQSYANTLHELSDMIADVRNEIFSSKEKVYSVSIGIPSSYFEDESLLVDVDIIDLPGDYPRDVSEYSSVRKVFGYYLQRATRIFFVNPEDKPKVLKQSFIDQQAHTYKSKSRIILTHIAQSETEQKEIPILLNQLDVDKCVEVIRDHYMKLIRSLDLKPEIEPEQLFAFSAGSTLEKMQYELKESLQPVLDSFIHLIIDDVNQSAQPSEILSQFSDIRNEVEEKLKEMENSFNDAISLIEKKIKNATDVIATIQGMINDLDRESYQDINYFNDNTDNYGVMHTYSLPELIDSYNERCNQFLGFIFRNSKLVKSNSINEIERIKRKLSDHISIDDDNELIQIFARKRKNVFLFIKGKNPGYPHEVIEHLNSRLYAFVESKNRDLNDLYESIDKHLRYRLKKHNRYTIMLQNSASKLQFEYESNRNTCLSQVDLCNKYFDVIENQFKEYYLRKKSGSDKGSFFNLDFLVEAYFISNRIIKARRCEG